jgi:hypothetical protein
MGRVPRYLLVNAVMGAAIGVTFGLILLVTDTLGLRSLVVASDDAVGAAAVLLIGSAMTFAPFVVTTAVMLISPSASRDDSP